MKAQYIVITLLAVIIAYGNALAQNITRSYHNESMPNVLRDIDSTYTDGNINFIYNELEDFTVTTTIIDKPIINALYEIIGFYPIKAHKLENDFYVECWQKEPNKVKGRLIDENRRPVEYANIALFNPLDSSFITSGVTNQNGDFVIPTSHTQILLKAHCIGYMPYSRIFETNNVGTIVIHTNAKLLSEVIVEEKYITYDGDKIITRPTATQVKHSHNIFSLLSQQPFPGMFVDDVNRSIRVLNGSPIIVIDGIKRSSKDLMGIDPKNVESIEYSNNVPMKYLDSGSTGIIYIQLKQRKDGGTFYSSVNASPTTGYINGDAGVSYNQGRSEFTFDYSAQWRDYDKRKVDTEESFISDEFSVDIDANGRNSNFDYLDHQINAGYTYRHDKSLTLATKLYNSLSNGHDNTMSDVTDSQMGRYFKVNKSQHSYHAHSLDIFFKKEWDNNQSIEAQIVGSFSDNENDRHLTNEFENSTSQEFISQVQSKHKSLISEISYTKIFNNKSSLSAGYQNSLSHTANQYITNDAETTLESNNNYAYLSYNQRIGKSSLRVGTGMKLIWMKSETDKRNFTRNLTYINFGMPISSKFSLSFNGRYTPSIPSLYQLTDVVQESDSYLVTNGNSRLKCSYDLFGRVQGYFNHKKFSGGIGVEYLYIKDPNYNNVTYIGNNQFLSRTENFNRYNRFGIFAGIQLTEIFDKHMTISLFGQYNHMISTDTQWKLTRDGFMSYINIHGYFGKWTVRAFYKIPDKYLFGNNLRKNENWSSLSIGYRPDKHWYLAVNGNLLFHSAGTEYPSWTLSKTNPQHRYVSIANNANMITFTVQYKLSFGRIFGKTKRTLNNKDSGPAVLKL